VIYRRRSGRGSKRREFLRFRPSVVVRVQWSGSRDARGPLIPGRVGCRLDDRCPVVGVTVWGWCGRHDVFRRRDHSG
jgi:hypothetical protein